MNPDVEFFIAAATIIGTGIGAAVSAMLTRRSARRIKHDAQSWMQAYARDHIDDQLDRIDELERRIAALEAENAALRGERDEAQRRERDLEMQVADLRARLMQVEAENRAWLLLMQKIDLVGLVPTNGEMKRPDSPHIDIENPSDNS